MKLKRRTPEGELIKRKPFETKDEFKERLNPKSAIRRRINHPLGATASGLNPANRKKLSVQEKAFVLEYMKDFTGTKAAERAGYNPQMGHVLLQRTPVLEAIDNYEKNLATRFVCDKNKVLKELSLLANSDIRDYIEIKDGKTFLKDMSELSPQVSRAIKKVKGFRKTKAIKDSKGNYTGEDLIDETIEIELYDKNQALTLLGKELKMFTERRELTGANGTPLVPVSLVLDFGEEKAE